MYFPKRYQEHNNALDRFVLDFNKHSSLNNFDLSMFVQKIENFRDDGWIKFPDSSSIKYDFEKRFTYYPSYRKFQFQDLGQFERKIAKSEIVLSIQSSSDETGFIFGFHSDFLKEERKYISSKTSSGYEKTAKRFTKRFIEVSYEDMVPFQKMLMNCYEYKKFSYSGCKLND